MRETLVGGIYYIGMMGLFAFNVGLACVVGNWALLSTAITGTSWLAVCIWRRV